jgi:hypothetical protein
MASPKQEKLSPKQLKRAFQRLEKAKKWLERVNYRLDELVKFGFKKVSHRGMSKTLYINNRLKIVIKTPFIINKKNIPERAIPTIILRRKETGYYKTIFIQPVAKVKNTGERFKAFRFLIKCGRSVDVSDCHAGNVCHFNGVACWLDW